MARQAASARDPDTADVLRFMFPKPPEGTMRFRVSRGRNGDVSNPVYVMAETFVAHRDRSPDLKKLLERFDRDELRRRVGPLVGPASLHCAMIAAFSFGTASPLSRGGILRSSLVTIRSWKSH